MAQFDEMSNVDKFLEATIITANKHGINNMIYLNRFLFDGNLGTFTRDNGARELASTIDRNMLFQEIQYRILFNASKLVFEGCSISSNDIINTVIGNAKNNLVNGIFSLEEIQNNITLMLYNSKKPSDLVSAITGNIDIVKKSEDLSQVSELLSQYAMLLDPNKSEDVSFGK